MVYAFNPSTHEGQGSGFLGVPGQHGLHSEFKDSKGYIEKLCLKKKKEEENHNMLQVDLCFASHYPCQVTNLGP